MSEEMQNSQETYRIVSIPDEYSVVVNIGAAQEIGEGDVLEIFEKGKEIIDPVTKDSLGTLDYIKATLEVVKVFEKMSLCQNRNRRSSITNLGVVIGESLAGKRDTLDVDEEQVTGDFSGFDSKIRIGDFVRKP